MYVFNPHLENTILYIRVEELWLMRQHEAPSQSKPEKPGVTERNGTCETEGRSWEMAEQRGASGVRQMYYTECLSLDNTW